MFNNQNYPFYSYQLGNNSFPLPYKQSFHINWKNLLNNTQKTLNVINQATPLFYQIKPLYNNIKTMLKVNSILRNNDEPKTIENKKKNIDSNKPIFYL